MCHTVDQGNLFSVNSTWIYLRLAADRRHWSIEKGPLMDNYARPWPCVKKGKYTVLYSAVVKFCRFVGLGWIRNCFLGMQIRSPQKYSTYRKCTHVHESNLETVNGSFTVARMLGTFEKADSTRSISSGARQGFLRLKPSQGHVHVFPHVNLEQRH